MNEKEIIEEMASDMNYGCVKHDLWPDDAKEIAKALVILGYRKIPEGSVVLTREEYEKLKSLYDCGGAYMTSQIGDLPLTVEGLRKAVDEITRLNRVETELQELNAKYYNEAKDLRRKLKEAQEFWKASYRTEQQARKETAREILKEIMSVETEEEKWLKNEPFVRYVRKMFNKIEEIAKQYGVEE